MNTSKQMAFSSRAYKGPAVRVKLMEYATREGEFSNEDIAVTGHGRVEHGDSAIWFVRPVGTMIVVQ